MPNNHHLREILLWKKHCWKSSFICKSGEYAFLRICVVGSSCNLKKVYSILKTQNLKVGRKNLKMKNNKHYWMKTTSQTQKELVEALNLHQSVVSKYLHEMAMVKNFDNTWINRKIEYRKITCVMLLQMQQRKSYLHQLVTREKKRMDSL